MIQDADLRRRVQDYFTAHQRDVFRSVSGLPGEQESHSALQALLPFLDPMVLARDQRGVGSGLESGFAGSSLLPFLKRTHVDYQIASQKNALERAMNDRYINIDGKRMSLSSARWRLMQEPKSSKREEIDRLYYHSVNELTSLQRTVIHALTRTVQKLGYESSLCYNMDLHEVDLAMVVSSINRFLGATEDSYRRQLEDRFEKIEGTQRRFLGCHIGYLSQFRELDTLFPEKSLVHRALSGITAAGLNNDELSGISLDLEDRPLKAAHASCFVPNPPHEVYISVRVRPGLRSCLALLHEFAHAAHFLGIDSELPFEARALSATDALTETVAWFVQFLAQEPEWVERVWGLDEDSSKRVASACRWGDFFLIRRFAGRVLFEADIHANRQGLSQRFQRTMEMAVGLEYDSRGFLGEFSPHMESLTYWRAWVCQAAIREHLVNLYGLKWFLDRRASEFWSNLFNRGLACTPESIMQEIGYPVLDPGPLIRSFKTRECGLK